MRCQPFEVCQTGPLLVPPAGRMDSYQPLQCLWQCFGRAVGTEASAALPGHSTLFSNLTEGCYAGRIVRELIFEFCESPKRNEWQFLVAAYLSVNLCSLANSLCVRMSLFMLVRVTMFIRTSCNNVPALHAILVQVTQLCSVVWLSHPDGASESMVRTTVDLNVSR